MMYPKAIASVQFSDGTTRLVYEDFHGQFVLDDQGEPTYGAWFVPPQELDAMFGPQQIIVSIDVGDLR